MASELVRQLSTGLDQAAAENIRLLKECGLLRRDLAKARAVIADNELELVASRQRHVAAEKKAESLTSEVTDLKLSLLQLKSKEATDKDMIKDLHVTIEEYKAKNDILEQRLAGSLRELEEQRDYEEGIETECTRLELDVRQLTAGMSELQTALAQAMEDKAGAENRREQMQREVIHLRQEVADLDRKTVPKATAERLALELANDRMALDTYLKHVRRLEEKLESMERRHACREEQHMERMAQIEALDNQLRTAQRREADALSEVEALRSQIERYRRETLEARLANENMRHNEDRLRAELRLAHERTAMAIKRLQEAEEEAESDAGIDSCDSLGSECSFTAAAEDDESRSAADTEETTGWENGSSEDADWNDGTTDNTELQVSDLQDDFDDSTITVGLNVAEEDLELGIASSPLEHTSERQVAGVEPRGNAKDDALDNDCAALVSVQPIAEEVSDEAEGLAGEIVQQCTADSPTPESEPANQLLEQVPTPKKRRDRRGHARYSNLGDAGVEKGVSTLIQGFESLDHASAGGQ